MTEWVRDKHGNKCSAEHFGSIKLAQEALDSLKKCKNCVNCQNCYGCAGCHGCYYCKKCQDCVDCNSCMNCNSCLDCDTCSDCYQCLDCEKCNQCRQSKGIFNISEHFEHIIVPAMDRIHTKVYAAASNSKALDMENWHTCKNTHCRAGWVVTLAGEYGRQLEDQFNTPMAAMMIYKASSPNLSVSPVQFFHKNKPALEDMKRMADLELASR